MTTRSLVRPLQFNYDHQQLHRLLVVLTTFIALDYIILKKLFFETSLKHQIMMNEEYYSRVLEIFFEFISILGDGAGVAIYLSFAACTLSRENFFICLMTQGIGCGLVTILKSANNEPRPYFLVENLNPRKCSLEHGDPSAHAFISTALLGSILNRLILQYHLKHPRFLWSIYVAFVTLIGMSRIYNGYHTYNQVLSGFIWGASLYYFTCKIIADYLIKFVRNFRFLHKNVLLWNPLTQFFVYGYLIQTLLYFYNVNYRPTPESWYAITKKNCPNRLIHIDPELSDFEKFSTSSTILGAILGLYIENNYLPTKDMLDHFKVPLIKSAFALAVTLIGMLLSVSISFVVSHNHPFILVLLCKSFLPCFGAGLYLMGFSRYVLFWFGLINTKKIYLDYNKDVNKDE
ncbi:pap2 superfamily phosphatase [Stylonychia lemnae]|uniref:Pap2 superfamily phosphatase n=1 Tax=Stylonychia lemnae TaxID=5949 RepID=A0A078A0V7_STYLE|nr:pap2 superfamily phosphatase [Stylonychia lemnae]|eukprot:CDW75497.1 pap2 superfamily phosphatase [Stylonychia lemnae]